MNVTPIKLLCWKHRIPVLEITKGIDHRRSDGRRYTRALISYILLGRRRNLHLQRSIARYVEGRIGRRIRRRDLFRPQSLA